MAIGTTRASRRTPHLAAPPPPQNACDSRCLELPMDGRLGPPHGFTIHPNNCAPLALPPQVCRPRWRRHLMMGELSTFGAEAPATSHSLSARHEAPRAPHETTRCAASPPARRPEPPPSRRGLQRAAALTERTGPGSDVPTTRAAGCNQ